MAQRPVAQRLVLCEQAVVEEGTRNITLVNCFERRLVDAFPTSPVSLVVFTMLADGLGDLRLELLFQRLDTLEDVASYENTFRFVGPVA